ncbi:hypothetical protein TNIN_363801 [Trichonephila inaurata madagascariensis]|uniref:Uncharacterized protein n=1 Tax=Trichonephila inaurata madagascariensis TaxID=2747483 RepID=A0A8X6IEC3_9ARAC|nr:hypothetical protein TNIN_363771 [Trichonephila inaurata madagascariensis]GFS42621.1 hypothetical protein TNIN_363801 [Trichonephila inaurata madagascariensis]
MLNAGNNRLRKERLHDHSLSLHAVITRFGRNSFGITIQRYEARGMQNHLKTRQGCNSSYRAITDHVDKQILRMVQQD